jgi:hypothetical protein
VSSAITSICCPHACTRQSFFSSSFFVSPCHCISSSLPVSACSLAFFDVTLKRISPDSNNQHDQHTGRRCRSSARAARDSFLTRQGSRLRDRHYSIALKPLTRRQNLAYCVADSQSSSAFFRQSNPGSLLHDLSCGRHARYTRQ